MYHRQQKGGCIDNQRQLKQKKAAESEIRGGISGKKATGSAIREAISTKNEVGGHITGNLRQHRVSETAK